LSRRPWRCNYNDGDLISIRIGGGGGYGDPLDREPELVRQDVVRGYVSIATALEEYEVVIDPQTLEVNYAHTAEVHEKQHQAPAKA